MLMLPEMGKPFLFLTKLLRTLVFPMSEQSHNTTVYHERQTTVPDPLPPALLPQPGTLGHSGRYLLPTFPLPPGLSPLSPLPRVVLQAVSWQGRILNPNAGTGLKEYYCTGCQNRNHTCLGAPLCSPTLQQNRFAKQRSSTQTRTTAPTNSRYKGLNTANTTGSQPMEAPFPENTIKKTSSGSTQQL